MKEELGDGLDESETVKLEIEENEEAIVNQDYDDKNDEDFQCKSDFSDSEPEEEIKIKTKRKSGVRIKGEQKYLRPHMLDKKCVPCNMYFRSEAKMMTHVDRHHGPKQEQNSKHTCNICFETFEKAGAKYYHISKYHTEKPPCPQCGKSFFQRNLKEHIKQAHTERIYKQPKTCEICGKVFTRYKDFHSHKTLHKVKLENFVKSDKKWLNKFAEICNCDIDLPNKSSKIEHMKSVHEGYQHCPRCEKFVKNIDEMEHRCIKKKAKQIEEPTDCPHCGKSYKKAALWYHIKVDHDNEPVACEVCGKVFQSYIHKRSHVSSVHKEKEACSQCGKVVSDMNMHIANVHTPEENKKHKCEYCGKGFVDSDKLKNHMNIHLNTRPYKCREGCDDAFNDLSNRNQHEKRLHGVRGELCGKKSQNSDV